MKWSIIATIMTSYSSKSIMTMRLFDNLARTRLTVTSLLSAVAHVKFGINNIQEQIFNVLKYFWKISDAICI